MSRSSAVASSSKDRRTLAVINARLIAECVETSAAGGDGVASPSADVGGRKGRQDGALGRRGGAGGGKDGAASESRAAVELHEVTSLAFGFRNIGAIDNLVGVRRLTKLQLDNNVISKIEKLDELVNLTWLDLSFNRITVIEGLDRLVKLENLSLYANDIAAVGGMDTLNKLMCLSLGRNKIEDLDASARYLHRFEHLRMLTLLGNRICAMPSYRQKVLAYNQRLKFLDHRLVLPAEIHQEANLAKEYITHVEDEDKRRTDALQAEKEAAEESARYDAMNVPHEAKLFEELNNLEPDGRPLKAMLALDFIREQTKEIVEEHQTKFLAKGKEMSDRMKELHAKRQSKLDDFEQTYLGAKQQCDDEAKRLIKAFEAKMKVVIPVALRARPTDDNFDEAAIQELRGHLETLKADLLELEATLVDSFENLLSEFAKYLATVRQEVVETIYETHFKALADIVKDHFVLLKSRLDHLFDDRLKALQEQAEQGGGSGGGGGSYALGPAGDNVRDKAALALFDSKEEYSKALHDTEALQVKRLEDKEEAHRKEEEARLQRRVTSNADREHQRSRSRVSEILAYAERQEQRITQWERSVE